MPERPDPSENDEVVPASRLPLPTPRGEGAEFVLPEELRSAEVRELIERAQQGCAEALNELFTRYYGVMVQLARKRIGGRLGQKEDADDLAQTTFREATRDFGQYEYRGEGSFLRWLAQILQNKIRDKAEFYSASKRDIGRERPAGELRREPEDVQQYDPPSRDLSVTQILAREEEFKILREALEDLSPDHRRAITLVFFQGLSLREAGDSMEGRSEDAVRMLLRRAESHLHERTRTRLSM